VSYDLIVVGASLGGLRAAEKLLRGLPADPGVAVVLAQHRGPDSTRGSLEAILQQHTRLRVVEAGDKDPIEPGNVYLAPPDYHLLVEPGSFALSVDERVQFARPSIDVLFESAADAYGERLIGIVLTGANADGAAGLAAVKRRGGVAVVQEPGTAEARSMPEAALKLTAADAVLPLEEIGAFVYGLCLSVPDRSPAA
jgi:two-component system chemotaxis response regulator CheB